METKYAFVKGRQNLDSILIANECVLKIIGGNKKIVVVRLDSEKAYDKTNFLDYIMVEKVLVLNGNHGCLDGSLLPTYLLSLNRSHKGFFPTLRRLRHGDPRPTFPVPPYIGRGLPQPIVINAKSKRLFEGFKVGSDEFYVSHSKLRTIHWSLWLERKKMYWSLSLYSNTLN